MRAKRTIPIFIAVVGLAVVASFQACSPMKSGTAPKDGGIDINQSTGPESKEPSSTSSENNGLPFDGKPRTFQHHDQSFCKSVNATQNIRQEIVRDGQGSWLTINDCKATRARDVANATVTDSEKSVLIFQNRLLPEIVKKNPMEHARITCYWKDTNMVRLVVYESADGLIVDLPHTRSKYPDFVPPSATRALEKGTHSTGNFYFNQTYRSAFWNKDYKGKFNLYLNFQASGDVRGMWYFDHSGADTASGGNGRCVVSPSIYPW